MIVLCVGGPNHGEEVAVDGGRGLEVVRLLPGRPTFMAASAPLPHPITVSYEHGRYHFAPVWQPPGLALTLVAGIWEGWPSDREAALAYSEHAH